MKKYAMANFIFGAVFLVYFLVFARVAISMNLLPSDRGNSVIAISIVFTIFVIIETIVSAYLMVFGIVLRLMKRIKIISGVFLIVDGIVKWIFALLCGVLSLLIVLVDYYPLVISAAIYTIILFVLAVMNVRVRKKIREG